MTYNEFMIRLNDLGFYEMKHYAAYTNGAVVIPEVMFRSEILHYSIKTFYKRGKFYSI